MHLIFYWKKILKYNNIQLIPALKVSIIIVHPGVLKTTSQGWTIMMFTASAGIVLLYWNSMQNKFDKCEHFCKWTARMVPLAMGTPAVAILYIRHVHVLGHGHFTDIVSVLTIYITVSPVISTGTCFIKKIYAPSSSLLQGKYLPFYPSPLRLNIFRLFVILSLTQLYRYTPEIFLFLTATFKYTYRAPLRQYYFCYLYIS